LSKSRLEAFSDGVIAIIITIMVLELRMPPGAGLDTLRSALPGFLMYVLSFLMLGIYWNNHHHMLHATDRVTGGVLWANLHLLFWLSLVPVTTAWMGEHYRSALPTAVYGIVLLLAAVAYYILQGTIIAAQGAHSRLKSAIGRDLKGKVSPLVYVAAVLLAFVTPWASDACYVGVALIWLVPDRRIEVIFKP
jgi:TMEM175 potassium channel family protein